jgi:hypothetical protein
VGDAALGSGRAAASTAASGTASGTDLRGESALFRNVVPCRSSATVGDAALGSGNAGSISGAASHASGAGLRGDSATGRDTTQGGGTAGRVDRYSGSPAAEQLWILFQSNVEVAPIVCAWRRTEVGAKTRTIVGIREGSRRDKVSRRIKAVGQHLAVLGKIDTG